MSDGITGVYNRINEIKSGAKSLRNFKKPARIKEFEEMYNNMAKNTDKSTETTKASNNQHPILLKKKSSQLSIENVPTKDIKDVEKDEMTKINDAISAAAKKYKVSEDLIRAVISVESGFNKSAISRTGAMGMMQLMPRTALNLDVEKPFDIYDNINGGVKYLKMMLDKYDNNLEKALAAYNAGPHRVDAANGIPDIDETKNYVRLIKKQLLGE